MSIDQTYTFMLATCRPPKHSARKLKLNSTSRAKIIPAIPGANQRHISTVIHQNPHPKTTTHLQQNQTMAPQKSTTYNPPSVPDPQPQFSQVNSITFTSPTKLIAITGQLAIQPDPSNPTPKAFDDQVRLALQNLGNCLEAAGATKRDIFKVTHHVVDFDYEKQNPAKVFIEWLEEGGKGVASGFRPASCMLPVQRLAGPDWFYEIECWAVVNLG